MSALTISELRCEYATNPIGLDVPKPRFSWLLAASGRNRMQSAFRVLVASSEENLARELGDRWDSDRVESDASVNLPYGGDPLESGERCYWNVRVWDGHGAPSTVSETATFEMGLLHDADWSGDWIQAPPAIAAPMMRKTFSLDKPVAAARMYLSGLGLYELTINGARVGEQVLDPVHTDYRTRVPYVSHDVTSHLRAGKNVIAVMLGNGWYRGLKEQRYRFSDSLALLLQLNITFDDGSTKSVHSDTRWRVASGPITLNSLQAGESYDARLEKTGWDGSDYNDSGWDTARAAKPPKGDLFSQQLPPMKVTETRQPLRLTRPSPGTTVFDFGQLFGGWVKIRVSGSAGTEITIKHAGRIRPDGFNDDAAHPGPLESDTYTLRGDPDGETYEPRFTFHPVHYVQVTGAVAAPGLGDVQGCVVHSDVDLTGEFACSNDLLNRIHSNVTWSMRNALKGFPLDCLHREPRGYNEPASVSSILYTRKHMPRFWIKWLADIRAAQWPSGALSDWAPEAPDSHRKPDAAQAGNFPPLVWYLYQYYDDLSILADNYAAMRDWVDYLGTIAVDGIISTGWLGDHMEPGPRPGFEAYTSEETPPPLIWTGYYFRGARVVADAAATLGMTADAGVYGALADGIQDNFNSEFFDAAEENYAGGSQTSNSFALLLGITPTEHADGVARNIRRSVMETHGGHIHTGHAGTTSMIELLTNIGDGETLFALATATTYPGWGYMVAEGATTIWESWGHDWAPDHNPIATSHRADSMMMWGCIDKLFYHCLAGIAEPAFHGLTKVAPGFREIEIRPQVVGDLTSARARIRTVRGMVSSSWILKDGAIELEVEVPVNTRATVAIPKMGWDPVTVTESGQPVFPARADAEVDSGILGAADAGVSVELRVGSGAYSFVLRGGTAFRG